MHLIPYVGDPYIVYLGRVAVILTNERYGYPILEFVEVLRGKWWIQHGLHVKMYTLVILATISTGYEMTIEASISANADRKTFVSQTYPWHSSP
ncbi:hypothetical protein HPP92_000612 [Vanilla planifolia]|uniref:Uncharacterized protein n=1 Tax=Vanilla planifolia TaxID=51239 RepID=A0A835RPI0_VANPL|nr:hypothetical protein HPP92_000612 [Vanilla planifolia]